MIDKLFYTDEKIAWLREKANAGDNVSVYVCSLLNDIEKAKAWCRQWRDELAITREERDARDKHIEEAGRLIESMFQLMDQDHILAMRGGVRTWLELTPDQYAEAYQNYGEWKDEGR